MKFKHFLSIILLNICFLPVMADDISFDIEQMKQLSNEIQMEVYSQVSTHNKVKISDPENLKKLAFDFVDRLHEVLQPGSEKANAKEFENLIKILKMDFIRIADLQENQIASLETFINAYHERSLEYGVMQTPLDLFLDPFLQGDALVNTLKVLERENDTKLTKEIIKINLNCLDLNSYISSNRKELLTNFVKTERPFLSHLSNIIESSLSKYLPQRERQLSVKLSILDDMINIADNDYQSVQETAKYSKKGQRTELRADALEKHFGQLKPEDAEFLSNMLKNETKHSYKNIPIEIQEWLGGFSRWSKRTLKQKGNNMRSIGAIVAIIAIEELINRSDYQYSNDYLATIDEINDSIATGNYINLVYKSIYDNDFAEIL